MVWIYCDQDGNVVDETAKLMERSMRRYWSNFARNGNPNDDSGAIYPDGLYDNDNLVQWDSFKINQGQLLFQSKDHRFSDRHIEMENNFRKDICDFWDTLDVYLKI